ncbi:hypothetical protein F4810DRAFT_648709 [Camillea tinctor]|nr:hypothetical protein F4810DRAFT_648709 [Camillea tinctor]
MRGSKAFWISTSIGLLCMGAVTGLCYDGWMIFREFAEQFSALSTIPGSESMGIPDPGEGQSRAVCMLVASILAAVWFTILLASIWLHDFYIRSRGLQFAVQATGTILFIVFCVLAGLSAGTVQKWQRFFESYQSPQAAGACYTVWLIILVSILIVSILYLLAAVLTLYNAGLLDYGQQRSPQDPPLRPRSEIPSTPSTRSSSVELYPLSVPHHTLAR